MTTKKPSSADLIVFDFDGTLIDSSRDLTLSVNHTLHVLGYAPLPESLVLQYVGNGVEPLLQQTLRRFGSNRVKEARSTFLKHYEKHLLDHTDLFPGVLETLAHFKKKKMAVLTNKPFRLTEKILKGLGIASFFSVVVGGDSLDVKKPDPGGLQCILRQLRIEPSKAMIVGDNPVDVQTGRAAETLTCGVTYGFSPESEVKRSAPDYLIPKITDLRKIIL